ncbi:hypothetical protein A4W93_07605 [Piscinibacter gummiphilus]|uniref:Uncharacterized protein n=2 Tax=Piscinibacter gummiphilus TaxID=946333 RepID=A0A1W6L6M5_9BURK|nr:hypothetical protein A4W93_07605 [Piscinibacter gummiphilus]GLS95138.1 hypothetical protein GCM10007918_24300 [Piscinibacter gummiphilus]
MRRGLLFVMGLVCASAAWSAGGTGSTALAWKHPGETLVYRSCGCADACWVAEVRDRRTSAVKARLRCDCEVLHFERLAVAAPPVTLGSCEALNGSEHKADAIGEALDALLQAKPRAGDAVE